MCCRLGGKRINKCTCRVIVACHISSTQGHYSHLPLPPPPKSLKSKVTNFSTPFPLSPLSSSSSPASGIVDDRSDLAPFFFVVSDAQSRLVWSFKLIRTPSTLTPISPRSPSSLGHFCLVFPFFDPFSPKFRYRRLILNFGEFTNPDSEKNQKTTKRTADFNSSLATTQEPNSGKPVSPRFFPFGPRYHRVS